MKPLEARVRYLHHRCRALFPQEDERSLDFHEKIGTGTALNRPLLHSTPRRKRDLFLLQETAGKKRAQDLERELRPEKAMARLIRKEISLQKRVDHWKWPEYGFFQLSSRKRRPKLPVTARNQGGLA